MIRQSRPLACESADACENCAAYASFIDDVVALHEDSSAVARELGPLLFDALHGDAGNLGWTRLYVCVERAVRDSVGSANVQARSRLAAFLAENSDLGLETPLFRKSPWVGPVLNGRN